MTKTITKKELLTGEKLQNVTENYLFMLKELMQLRSEAQANHFNLHTHDGREAFRAAQRSVTKKIESREFNQVKSRFRIYLDGMKRFIDKNIIWNQYNSFDNYDPTASAEAAEQQIENIHKEIILFRTKYTIKDIFV